MDQRPKPIGTILNTPFLLNPIFVVNLVFGWGLGLLLDSRLRPQASLLGRLGMGGVHLLMIFKADIAHACGHIISAKRASAPVSRVILTFPSALTEYDDKSVSPAQHQARASGGPIMSFALAVVDGLARLYFKPDSTLRQVMTASGLWHLIYFVGGILPLPFFDGGSLMKWRLVEQGLRPNQADRTLGKINSTIGRTILVYSVALALAGWPKAALASFISGASFLATGLGKLTEIKYR